MLIHTLRSSPYLSRANRHQSFSMCRVANEKTCGSLSDIAHLAYSVSTRGFALILQQRMDHTIEAGPRRRYQGVRLSRQKPQPILLATSVCPCYPAAVLLYREFIGRSL